MSRRRYLIAYDIAHPRRLRLTCKVMEGYGDRLQYSVFLCDLSGAELAQWERDIRPVLNLGEDSIVVIDLGRPETVRMQCLGVMRQIPHSGPTVV
ncbi:MAG: CRISPR-associated endonuclease Cas2 [Intrasporangium sp.]|uniref:CRISPR-associated endonuclease Cas2 n=1 Tax=Intrasporangium sp. TaxID=1925024 RepID=UPI0026476269|nr:CRISPR-associated endonuclease Cas2 [Intrasporangium sp.]MDN5797029.1 CRISPR-associated endonuclease Cas2 [Intrasporangium sp.]